MLCISRFLIRCYISDHDVRNNVFLNCNFAKVLTSKPAKFWTTFLQLGVHIRLNVQKVVEYTDDKTAQIETIRLIIFELS